MGKRKSRKNARPQPRHHQPRGGSFDRGIGKKLARRRDCGGVPGRGAPRRGRTRRRLFAGTGTATTDDGHIVRPAPRCGGRAGFVSPLSGERVGGQFINQRRACDRRRTPHPTQLGRAHRTFKPDGCPVDGLQFDQAGRAAPRQRRLSGVGRQTRFDAALCLGKPQTVPARGPYPRGKPGRIHGLGHHRVAGARSGAAGREGGAAGRTDDLFFAVYARP